jgi:hypothetical protein
VIKENGRCTFNLGHYAHATNNAMEIRAVVEALRILPEGMHVWVRRTRGMSRRGSLSGCQIGFGIIGAIPKVHWWRISRCGRL